MYDDDKQPPPHYRRITVDVNAVPLPSPAVYGGGRDDLWTDDSTSVLINAWAHRYVELQRGNITHINWNEISAIFKYGITPKTDIQCKNRIDAVINKYKFEKSKVLAGCRPTYWPFYHLLDRIISPVQEEVPVGIPLGIPQPLPLRFPLQQQVIRHDFPFTTPFSLQQRFNPRSCNVVRTMEVRPPEVVNLDSDSDTDSEKEHCDNKKRQRVEMNVGRKGKEKKSGMDELMAAIGRFGEAYEAAEMGKLEDMVEIEKHRMVFVKEMEIQRIEFLMKMQLEFSQFKGRRGDRRSGGGGEGSYRHRGAIPVTDRTVGAYYGYRRVYDAYGYAPPSQDPNMNYPNYVGYRNYQQPHQLAMYAGAMMSRR